MRQFSPHSTRKPGPTASQQSSPQPPVPQLAQYVMQPEGFNLVLETNLGVLFDFFF